MDFGKIISATFRLNLSDIPYTTITTPGDSVTTRGSFLIKITNSNQATFHTLKFEVNVSLIRTEENKFDIAPSDLTYMPFTFSSSYNDDEDYILQIYDTGINRPESLSKLQGVLPEFQHYTWTPEDLDIEIQHFNYIPSFSSDEIDVEKVLFMLQFCIGEIAQKASSELEELRTIRSYSNQQDWDDLGSLEPDQ